MSPAVHPLPSGSFVAFEGGEGTGKTTQIRFLADVLTVAGHDVLCTREPGGTTVGAQIRKVLLHGEHVDPRAEALLFAADRAHHVNTLIRPALNAGRTVITDRYIESSVAYQSGARGLDADDIRYLSRWATQGLTPDLTILLDLDPRIGSARAGRRSALDRMEREAADFHDAVRAHFLTQADADPDRFLVVDASGTLQEIARIIRNALDLSTRGQQAS